MAKSSAPYLPLAQLEPHGALNVTFQLNFSASTSRYAPLRCPSFHVPPGATVTVRTVSPNTAQSGLNNNAIYVGQSPEELASGGGLVIPPGASVAIPWPVDNTHEIFVWGSVNDGCAVSVQGGKVG